MAVDLKLDHKIDPKTNRHFINNTQVVLHCHHYTSLYTQLAIDIGETDLLVFSMEDSFYKQLSEYYEKYKVESIDDKKEIAVKHYSTVGLGTIEIISLDENGGEVKSEHSLLDQGWIKKWDKYDAPVNYIGCGFIAAMYSSIWGKPTRTFKVIETKSIVKGDSYTLYKISKNN